MQEVLRKEFGAGGNPDPAEEVRAHDEGDAVQGQRGARAGGDHEDAADRRADDAHRAARQPLQRIRLLQSRRADRLRDQPDLGRHDEPVAGTVEKGQTDEGGQRGVPRQDDGRRRSLRAALYEGGPDEHPVARKPIREHSSEEQDRSVRSLASREDDAQIRGAAHVQDREGERDVRDRVAERRDQRRREEQAEFALDERAQASGEECPHERSAYALQPADRGYGHGVDVGKEDLSSHRP